MIQVPYVPEWAAAVILARESFEQSGVIGNGESCFAVVRRKAMILEEKAEQQEVQWVTSEAWKATKYEKAEHRSAKCTCSRKVCTCRCRCRCMDCERKAYQSIRKPNTMTYLKGIQVYSELQPCKDCEAFRDLSKRTGVKVTCFWSAKNNTDLMQQLCISRRKKTK